MRWKLGRNSVQTSYFTNDAVLFRCCLSRSIGAKPSLLRCAPVCFALAIFCVLLTGCTESSSPQSTASSALTLLGGPEVHLGDLFAVRSHVANIVLQNNKSESLRVTLDSGCACTSISPNQFDLPAGGSQSVELKIDFTTRDPEELAMTYRPFHLQLLATLNKELPACTWRICANVIQPFRVSVSELQCEAVVGTFAEPMSISVERPADATPIAAETDCSFFKAVVHVVPESKKSVLVELLPVSTVPLAGDETFTLKIRGEHPLESGAQVHQEIPLKVRALNDIHTVPATHFVGTAPLGVWVEEWITIESHTGRRFKIVGAKASRGRAEITELRGGYESSHSIGFKLMPEHLESSSIVMDVELRETEGDGNPPLAGIARSISFEVFYFGVR